MGIGTPFEDIYKRAIFKFSDYRFLDLDTELKEQVMFNHLLSAIADFTNASSIPLTFSIKKEPECDCDYEGDDDPGYYPDDNGDYDYPDGDAIIPADANVDYYPDKDYQYEHDSEPEESVQYVFDYDIGIEEQEILVLGLVFHWLSSKVLNSELLHNVMHNSDYKSYSPANLLKEMQSLRANIKTEFVGRINTYSFRRSNLANMRTFRGGS